MTPRRPLRAVLITQDPSVRGAITSFVRDSGGGLAVVLDLDVSLSGFTGAQFKAVEQAAPALVFVDFDGAPDLGVSLARDLARANESLLPVGIGDALSSDLLLQAIRAGLAEFLVKPLQPDSLLEAVDRLAPRLKAGTEEGATLARTLAFFSAKGGSGSSTVVTNLAIEIRRATGQRTLVVDLDAELGEVSLLLGVQPQFNLVDLVQNFHRMDAELLSSYIEQHSSGVHLLSAPFHPERAATMSPDDIRQVLLYLRGQYDWVLLDMSKSFSPESLAAFEQSDEVFLVATVDLPSLRNIQRALPLLKRVMPRGMDQIHLIINRYDAANEISLKDVERSLGLKIYLTLANDYEPVIRSINSGKPVVLNDPKCAYARDIRSLGSRISGSAASPETSGEDGILERFASRFRVVKPDGPEKGAPKRA
jgi:pilus assembly protein CpaE